MTTEYTPEEQAIAIIHSDYVDGLLTEEEYEAALEQQEESDDE